MQDDHGPTVDVRISSSSDADIEVCFEPVGTTFSLHQGSALYLRLPASALSGLEIIVWPTGIAVWVSPYPGDYVVLDADKHELDRL
jgi:hypothetical protein